MLDFIVKVKICGITNLGDALDAVRLGADALGFMFYEPSPRYIRPEAAGEIVRALPPFVAKVGVFVNASRDQIRRAIETAGLDTVQLHGDEQPDDCAGFGVKTVKAFRVQNRDSLAALPAFRTDAWLLDSFVPGKLGGTGALFNWDLAVEAKSLGAPVILAGGLTPENAASAASQVRPYALDVSSGVESSPGKKDPAKIERFIAAVRRH